MSSTAVLRYSCMKDGAVLADHAQYRIVRSLDEGSLLFDWKAAPGLSAADFAAGIAAFAKQCEAEKPKRAVIDARQLDQGSGAMRWLRGQSDTHPEPYAPWWLREIVPLYHAAGIASLTVATGDPNAPGAIEVPDGVTFAVGYFTDLETAMTWAPA